jgi:hypothetical protein
MEDALREQDTPEEEILDLSKSMMRLKQWQAPSPFPADTKQLVDRLIPYIPVTSPIRQTLRERPTGPFAEFFMLFKLVRTQISIFQFPFWVVSFVIVLLGSLLMLGSPILNSTFLLQVIGPFLSYLGTATAFRGDGLHMLEFELACPPSFRQLTLARLAIILGYDTGLGLFLSLILYSGGGFGFWPITLHWLAPMLFGVGMTLLLSLRIPVHQAAVISYVGWLAILVSALIGQNGVRSSISIFSWMTEIGFSLVGMLMIAAVMLLMPKAIPGLMPRK